MNPFFETETCQTIVLRALKAKIKASALEPLFLGLDFWGGTLRFLVGTTISKTFRYFGWPCHDLEGWAELMGRGSFVFSGILGLAALILHSISPKS